MKPGNSLSRSFLWLNATQFFGALNDNIFKLLVFFFLIGRLGAEQSSTIVAIGGAIFVVPFLLFTPTAGILADRLSKRNIIVAAKVFENVVMLAGVAAFAVGQTWMLYGVLFMMSAQSALFGPAKYGIVRELVGTDNLSRANSFIVAWTFLAIIIGTACGPMLADLSGGRYALAASVCVVVAIAGTITSFSIERTPPAGSNAKISLFFLADVWKTVKSIRNDRYLLLAIFAGAYFYLLGAFLQLNLIPYGLQHLGLSEIRSGYLFLLAASGIGAGALLAGKLSGRHVEFGVVPLGAFGLTVCTVGLNLISVNMPAACVLIFFTGVSSGLFIVPLQSFIQMRSPRENLGEVLAANGFISWIGVLVASAVIYALSSIFKFTAAQGFLIMGVLTLVLTVITVKVLPDFLIRFIALVLTRSMYRIKTIGLENVPVEGGGLLVSNHVSYMDALQILACQQRRIRFMMGRWIYEKSFLKPIFRLMGIIPVSMSDSPKKIVQSLKAARQAVDDGYLVCIFAEGMLTRTGTIHQFKPGLEKIVKNSSVPIIPVYIGGTWGSIFSHYYTKSLARRPVKFPYPVTIVFGKPLPSTAKAWEVRQAVMELSCTYFESLKPARKSLAHALVATARKNWKHHAMSDTTGKRLDYKKVLVGAIAFADVLKTVVKGDKNVGILLPTSVGGALTNFAVTLLGKVSVNLNFTASAEGFQSAIQQASIKTILTSRAFIEKFPHFASLPGLVFVEDLFARITTRHKIWALIKARCFPASWIAGPGGPAHNSWKKLMWAGRPRPAIADQVATIIFSSGTTGEPKGVMLSHHNLLSNIESLNMVFRPQADEDMCSVLPLFHSFGFTCGLWFPILTGISSSFHTSPLDSAKIVEVIRENRCTLLFATPTFLMSYLRRADKEDFKTLRHVVVGAEKLKDRLADAFEEKFGVRPLEGYGATELSPVAALSMPDVEIDGVYQAGGKRGSVGQAVPGVDIKIIDPDAGTLKPPGEAGLVLVKGPNVMLGYLGKPELYAEMVKDGWYQTGDIAVMDEDGFITITDRLARFSKIGGEMIPHIALEEIYLKGLNTTEQVVAVTSVPDEKRGEKIVVLYTAAAGDPAALHAIIEKSPVPNLWKPDLKSYFQIDHIPLMGSGKLDVRGLREIAKSKL